MGCDHGWGKNLMGSDAGRGSGERISAFNAIIDAEETTLYDAVQALMALKDEDIQLLGKTRAQLAAELLERFPVRRK